MKKILFCAAILAISASAALGQQAKIKPKTATKTQNAPPKTHDLTWPVSGAVPPANHPFSTETTPFKTLPPLSKIVAGSFNSFQITRDDDGLPIFIESTKVDQSTAGSLDARLSKYLESLTGVLRTRKPETEFSVQKITTDPNGMTHVRLQQTLGGLAIYGGEMIAHTNSDGAFFRINGRHFATPNLTDFTPEITQNDALEFCKKNIGAGFHILSAAELRLTGGRQFEADLVIFIDKNAENKPYLAYKTLVYANVLDGFEMMVDANTGRILQKTNRKCSIDGGRIGAKHRHDLGDHSGEKTTITLVESHDVFVADGPTNSSGIDLLDVTRNFDTYEKSGKQYMIDFDEVMKNAGQSTFPGDPVGAILTLDAKNTSPQNNNFTYDNLQNSSLNWTGANNKKAISAHWNGQQSYTYFENKHGRKSIDGVGGNIIALVNVADDNGTSMENAFWNGEAMFYGNGGSTFKPLARGLDVGGHEMTHGVVEKTANLEYQGESGAMNESFADIFGAMIDSDDWHLGEDVMQAGQFPTGFLRDFVDPHNGGTSLNDPWYQPKKVSEKYNGSEDNGGVHINSGIPNHAYYLFATNGAVGKDKAEKIFYKALDAYLVKSSKFKDLRVSVLASCNDIFPGNATIQAAAAAAFDAVGITGPSTSGGGGPTPPPPGGNYSINLQPNPGAEYMLVTTDDYTKLDVIDATGAYVFDEYLYEDGLISRPSVTDDGKQIVFVNKAGNVVLVNMTWGAPPTHTTSILTTSGDFRNAAVSKDGELLATLNEPADNQIYIFGTGTSQKSFTLYNPTYSNGNAQTDEVQYADVIEWDFSGQNVIYDAYNEVLNSTGDTISWWDIGTMNVWKTAANVFAEGKIEKLFSGLPENTSVGNPTFSKNSPFIVGFDYIDDYNEENYVVGVNTQSGDNDVIYKNNALGWPTFSRLDSKVAFEHPASGTSDIGTRGIAASKIIGTGNLTTITLSNSAKVVWPVYFANGVRSLMVSIEDDNAAIQTAFEAYPNPALAQILVNFEAKTRENAQIELRNSLGQIVFSKNFDTQSGKNQVPVWVENLPSGAYFLKLTFDGKSISKTILKG